MKKIILKLLIISTISLAQNELIFKTNDINYFYLPDDIDSISIKLPNIQLGEDMLINLNDVEYFYKSKKLTNHSNTIALDKDFLRLINDYNITSIWKREVWRRFPEGVIYTRDNRVVEIHNFESKVNSYCLKTNESQIFELHNFMNNIETVDYIFLNSALTYFTDPILIPNDFNTPDNSGSNRYFWHLQDTELWPNNLVPTQTTYDIDAFRAWYVTEGNLSNEGEVIVGIIDDGVGEHIDLEANRALGGDGTSSHGDHGIKVAGIISGVTNNIDEAEGGICSVGWNTQFISYEQDNTLQMESDILSAIEDAVDIINISSGDREHWFYFPMSVIDELHDYIITAYNAGIIIVAASGNEGEDMHGEPLELGDTIYPAAFPEVIAVGATSNNGTLVNNSNYGSFEWLDFVAPGYNLHTTANNNEYDDEFSATSAASPVVAGVIALILDYAISNDLPYEFDDIYYILASTSEKVDADAANYDDGGYSITHGYGKVNAYRALLKMIPPTVSDVFPTNGDIVSIEQADPIIVYFDERQQIDPESVPFSLSTYGTISGGVGGWNLDLSWNAWINELTIRRMDNNFVPGETVTITITDDVKNISGEYLELNYEWSFQISELGIEGCTDPTALNYDPEATIEDGSCLYGILGDLDLNNLLDILDIVAIVSIVIGDVFPNEYQLWAADWNEDSSVDVLDIVGVVQCVITSCLEPIDCPCIDIDGNSYETIHIGNQCWMSENLKVTHYRNGDEIPTGYSNSEWGFLSVGAYSYYNNNSDYVDVYGNLYNWYAASDPRNVAPEGWHIPSDEEWMELEMYLGMSIEDANETGDRGTNEGSKLAGNAEIWSNGALEYNEEFGTSGLMGIPGGYRLFYSGHYYDMGTFGMFWSSTAVSGSYSLYRRLYYNITGIGRYTHGMQSGMSIRCVKDLN